ncbi:MAG: DUF1365 domain-containing protein, partial [Desulfobacterales bacterium]
PMDYRFSYRVFSLRLDLDELPDLRLRFLSVNRFNLLSFYERDHGPRDGSALKAWAEDLLRRKGIDIQGGRIQLLCFPRVLGYGFNPLSIWYCHHRDGSLRAVIAEVNNTFGEHHFYLLSNDGLPLTWPVTRSVEKVFQVSPLMGMQASYSFRLAEPSDRLSVLINQFQNGALTLVASQQGEGHALNDKRLLAALFRMPLMTVKVMAAIHWQALKIWLRGAPFFPKPAPPIEEVTQ